MNEDIIRLARQAGGGDWGIFRDFMPEIERFSNLLLDEENERLALLVEEMGIKGYGTLAIAAAIRQRRRT